MIKTILWDMDGTLMDFKASEKASLKATFKHFFGEECDDETVKRYSKINQGYWEKLERNEVTKEQVLRCRFEDFLSLEGIKNLSPTQFCEYYESGLANIVVYIDNSLELLKELKGKFSQYVVTNGAKSVQRKKLKNSHFDKILDGIFISDEIGYEKPSKMFFDVAISKLENQNKDEILIVGDSLTSDIKGGNNAGIKTCFYNPFDVPIPDEYNVDFVISNLNEIKNIFDF